MNRSYDDLLSLTTTRPSFFQKDGVPRWGAFVPGVSTGVYAVEAAIMEIACQCCDARFHVLVERASRDGSVTLASRIEDSKLQYGDPPRVDCCANGESMTSEAVRVVEFWSRHAMQWTRIPALERAFRRFGDPLDEGTRARFLEALNKDDDGLNEIIRNTMAEDDARRAKPETRSVQPSCWTEYVRSDGMMEDAPLKD